MARHGRLGAARRGTASPGDASNGAAGMDSFLSCDTTNLNSQTGTQPMNNKRKPPPESRPADVTKLVRVRRYLPLPAPANDVGETEPFFVLNEEQTEAIGKCLARHLAKQIVHGDGSK